MGTQLPVFKPLFTVLYGNYLWCICFFSKLFSFFAAHRFVSKYYRISKSWHPWLLVSKSDWCLLNLTLTYNVGGGGAHKGLGKGCLPTIRPAPRPPPPPPLPYGFCSVMILMDSSTHKHSLQKGIKGNKGHFFYKKWHCWGRVTSFKMAANLTLIAI